MSVRDFPRELQGVIRCINNFHSGNDGRVDIAVADLANLFFAGIPAGKDREFYQGVFDQLDKCDASAETTQKLIDAISLGNMLRDLSTLSYETAEGKGKLEEVMGKIEQIQSIYKAVEAGESLDQVEFVTDDLTVLVNESIRTHGLRWRLNTLNRMLGSLRQGDFGFIFARPETGKTTFLASEVSHMASQASGPVLWVNNEEQGRKVMLRLYQATLGVDLTSLYRDLEGNKRRYHELTKGNIRLYDSASVHKRSIEKICRQLRPSLIIFDQIDKIQGFDNDREDLRLGSIYIWARELAKTYAPVIGVCQADGTGEGVRWLTMSHVANAKTAKQAEADWILGIGKVHDAGFDNIRYLHASKNKLTGDEDTIADDRHGRKEVLIHPNIARYGDIG